MIKWSALCFVIAIVAAFFGFGIVASDVAAIAKMLFFVFVALCAATLITGLVKA